MHNQTISKCYNGSFNTQGNQKVWKVISYWFISIFSIIGLVGCTTPGQHFNDVAYELGLYAQKLDSHQFQHIIYENNILAGASETLHVYIDGDGTPWERNRWISDDPSARNPLILRLMIQDTMPSILLGRPCYYGLSNSPGCENKYWTSHRYSKEVIQSMSQALKIWLEQHKFNQLVLIGYSGGGTIAILMADIIKTTTKVVTVAANLDVTAWSKFHGYSKLKNSLNPSDEDKLKAEIQQFHFTGTDDNVVPPFIVKKYAENQENAKYYQFNDIDHGCCWEKEWPNILGLIE